MFLVALALSASLAAEASGQTLLSTGFDHTFAVERSGLPGGRDDARLALPTFFASGRIPISFESTSTVFIPGVSYRGTYPQIKNAPSDGLENFHEIGIELTVVQKLAADWSLILRFLPSLATNFEDIDANHVRYAGGLLAQYRHDESFSVSFGIIANYWFGEWRPLPGVGVNWKPTDFFRLDAFLPAFASFTFIPVDFLEIGLGARIQGNRYTVGGEAAQFAESVQYTVADAHAFVGFRLYKGLWLSARGGHTVHRNLELLDSGNNSLGSDDFENAPLVGATLEFRVK